MWRRRRRRGSNGRAVMRCVSDAFSGDAVLAAAPVNHDYNGEERWEHWCRKSRSDNYNARDKIMGTCRTLPITSCISSPVTSPPPLPPPDNRQSGVMFVKSKKNSFGDGRAGCDPPARSNAVLSNVKHRRPVLFHMK